MIRTWIGLLIVAVMCSTISANIIATAVTNKMDEIVKELEQ